jgi:hypothetical protein
MHLLGRGIPSAPPGGIGPDRPAEGLDIQGVTRRGLGGPHGRCGALDHVGKPPCGRLVDPRSANSTIATGTRRSPHVRVAPSSGSEIHGSQALRGRVPMLTTMRTGSTVSQPSRTGRDSQYGSFLLRQTAANPSATRPERRGAVEGLVPGLPRALWLLPTRHVVTDDEPHPAARWRPSPAGSEHVALAGRAPSMP